MEKNISLERAVKLVLVHAHVLPPVNVPIAKTVGLIMAEDITADRDYPLFDRAMMDGFAVCTNDAGCKVESLGEVAAGDKLNKEVKKGFCVAIMTGAPCPPGTEAVVKIEDVHIEKKKILLPSKIKSGQHFAKKGSECLKGDVIAGKGEIITPLILANLATFNKAYIKVHKNPSLLIVTTGNELIQPEKELSDAQIRDSNGPMLEAMARCSGISDIRKMHVEDTHQALARVLEQTPQFDIVIFTGGVSEGQYDLVPDAFKNFGAKIIFHKVRQKPGKPMLFATKGSTLLFGLPGTPLGTHLGFQRYVLPVIRKITGNNIGKEIFVGRLTSSLSIKSNRPVSVLAKAEKKGKLWHVTHLKGQGSSDIFKPALANVYIVLPKGTYKLSSGSDVEFEMIWS